MQPPKLTPRRARLLAFSASICLIAALGTHTSPRAFADASEIPVHPEVVRHSEFEASIPPPPPDDPPLDTRDVTVEDNGDELYAPDFAYFDSSLVGRQEDDLKDLNNNQMIGTDIAPNTKKFFRFKKNLFRKRSDLEGSLDARDQANNSDGSSDTEVISGEGEQAGILQKKQAQNTLWISANTCKQPTPNIMIRSESAPQLSLTVYTSTNGESPKAVESNSVGNTTFHGGYANFTLSTDQDVLIEVSAPRLGNTWNGSWHFEIAATLDEGYYHNYNNASNFIYMVDTDSDSTLFITHNLTGSDKKEDIAKWKKLVADGKMPFTMYTFPSIQWNPPMGLEHSFCGLKEQAKASRNLTVDTSITTNFDRDGKPRAKGQFHIQGLNASTNYTGFLVLNGGLGMEVEGTKVKGGGQVFKSFEWTTKADDSCQVIFGLEECASVSYAVPSSTRFKNNDSALIEFYDSQAKSYMENFRKSLAQIACDTAATAQYSLARTCKDCERDYRNWLCSVLIPRCEDWTATDPWLHPRNINAKFADGTVPTAANFSFIPGGGDFNDTMRARYAFNQSRNKAIDETIKPGPYKELLPCEDLCFDIVRSCPAALKFSCPSERLRGLSYGQQDPSGLNLKCNFPGAVVDLNQERGAAGRLGVGIGLVSAVAAGWGVILLM